MTDRNERVPVGQDYGHATALLRRLERNEQRGAITDEDAARLDRERKKIAAAHWRCRDCGLVPGPDWNGRESVTVMGPCVEQKLSLKGTPYTPGMHDIRAYDPEGEAAYEAGVAHD